MSRRTNTIVGGALVLSLGGGAAWWWTRSNAPPADTDVESVDADAQLVRDRWEARRGTGDAQAPCSARGRVSRASDGTGVANATVTLTRPQIITSPEPIVAKTDASGEWSVDSLVPGRYDFAVTSAELRPHVLRGVVLSAGKDHPNVDQALEAGGTALVGRITDPNGKPIAGARFEAIRMIDQSGGLPSLFATIADADGRYALRLDPEHYMVGVVHPDHVRIRSRMLLTDTPRTRDYRLVPGGVIRGRVLARADGQAIAGAILRVQDPRGKFGGETAGYETRAISDERGAFELRGLPSGAVSLVVTAPGWTNVELTTVPLGVAETVEGVEVLADPAHRLSGFIVAADDETAGIRDVALVAFDLENPAHARISEPSQADGYFVVHGMAPGRYWVIAWGTEIVATFDQAVEIGDHDIDDHLIRAERGHALRGRVDPPTDVVIYASIAVDSGQAGLFGLRKLMRSMMSTFRAVRPRPDGTFELTPLAAGDYTIAARGRGGMRGAVDVKVADADATGITIPLSPGLRLRGQVRDSAGVPISGLTVGMISETPGKLSLSSMFTGSGLEAVTDEAGRYEIAGLEPGRYKYQVKDDLLLGVPWASVDGSEASARERIVEVETNRELDIVIAPARVLSGRVVDDRGEPVAGAWVVAWPELEFSDLGFGFGAGYGMAPTTAPAMPDAVSREMARHLSTMFAQPAVLTDREGRFEIEGIRRSLNTITAHAERGQLIARAESVQASTPIELRLRPVGALRVALTGAPAGGSIGLMLEGPETQRIQIRETDEYAIERLVPGRWRVVVEAPGGTAAGEAEVTAGGTAELELELAAWSSITGTIVDHTSGDPIGGLHAVIERKLHTPDEVMQQGMQWMSFLQGGGPDQVDAQGHFTVDRLPPGPVTVEFIALPDFDVRAELRVADLRSAETRDVGRVPALVLDEVPVDERGWLGVDTHEVGTPGQLAELRVKNVVKGSPGEAAGVRSDDVVTRIDDAEIEELGAVVVDRLLSRKHLRVGDERTLVVRRVDGSRHTLTLRATRKPP